MLRQVLYRAMTDAALVTAMSGGDKMAFDEIYDRYWRKLYSESFKRMKNIEVIEEIVQDVFTDLWVKRETRDITNLESYLAMSIRYQVFGVYRKTMKLPEFVEPREDMGFTYLQSDSLLDEKELKGCIAIWLATQPEKRGEIFRLKFIEDMSTKEISNLLNISQKTVQNQLITAFASLREFLKNVTILFILF